MKGFVCLRLKNCFFGGTMIPVISLIVIQITQKEPNFSKFVHLLMFHYPTKLEPFGADKIDNFNKIDKNNEEKKTK